MKLRCNKHFLEIHNLHNNLRINVKIHLKLLNCLYANIPSMIAKENLLILVINCLFLKLKRYKIRVFNRKRIKDNLIILLKLMQ